MTYSALGRNKGHYHMCYTYFEQLLTIISETQTALFHLSSFTLGLILKSFTTLQGPTERKMLAL